MAQLEVINKVEEIKGSVTKDQEVDVVNFVDQFNSKKADKLVNTEDVITNFNSNSGLILKKIENNIKEKMKDPKIQRDKQDDPTVNTFIKAQKAFADDLGEYSKKEGGNILSDELKKTQDIGNMITNKQTEKERNKINLQESLNKNRTTETAKNFFETSDNKNNFDVAFDEVSKIEQNKLDEYKTAVDSDGTKGEQVKNYVDLIKKYVNDDKISNICLKKASNEDSIYPEGTRIITFTFLETIEDKSNPNTKKTTEITKEIIFGSQDQMQKTKSEKFDITKVDLSMTNPLTQFDGRGNYRSFEKYITENPDKFNDNFKNTINAIIGYKKPGKDTKNADTYESEDGLKNGYGNALTDYIVSHPNLLKTYITYLTKDNLNVLGEDKATRIANYNKLVPALKSIRDTLDPADKKRLVELGNTIGAQEKMTPQEILSKGLDSLIDAFGPMLFSILKMFGINKKGLLRMFPNAKDKINEIFAKEYGLSEDQIKAINNIAKDENFSKEIKTLTTGNEMKQEFKNNISSYIKTITDGENDEKKNYTFINVNVLQKSLNLYDKDKKININDVVTIKTDSKTKKQSITEIKDPKIFEGIMQSFLDSDATRSKINTASEEIITPTEAKKKKGNEYNDLFDKIDEAQAYAILSQQDIARYLTASLFSDKDLSSVIIENELKNNEIGKMDMNEYQVKQDVNIRNVETGIVENTLKKDDMVYETFDFKGKKTTTTAKDLNLKITDLNLKDEKELDSYLFTRVTTNEGKEGWVANEFLQQTKKFENKDKTKNPEQEANDLFLANEKTLTNKLTNEALNTFIYNPNATGNRKEYQENLIGYRGYFGSITRVPDDKTNDLLAFNNRDFIIKRGGKLFGDTTKNENIYHLKNMLSILNGKGTVTEIHINSSSDVTTETVDYKNSKLPEVIDHLDPQKRSYEEKIDQSSKSINLIVKEKETVIGTITLAKDTNGKLIPTRTENKPSA